MGCLKTLHTIKDMYILYDNKTVTASKLSLFLVSRLTRGRHDGLGTLGKQKKHWQTPSCSVMLKGFKDHEVGKQYSGWPM